MTLLKRCFLAAIVLGTLAFPMVASADVEWCCAGSHVITADGGHGHGHGH